MTNYNSQGRTRKYNVVDLNNCRSHQFMYTCLSRGSTYHGTAIVQGFTASKIQTGINSYLRQEFRELEMLNDITKLYYDCQLPATIGGVTRKQVIYTFRQWKGQNYVPENVSEHILGLRIVFGAMMSLEKRTYLWRRGHICTGSGVIQVQEAEGWS